MRFDGKVVVVTGGSRGLGKETVLEFANRGADVAVNFVKRASLAEEVVDQVRGLGRKAIAIGADVRKEDEVEAMIKKVIDEIGSPDILVNNAAVNLDSSVAKMADADWREVIDVDLSGVFLCTKHAIPVMKEKGWGRIVNVSSVVGQVGIFGTPAYAAAKAGVIAFTKSAAREVARRGITVNAVALGYFDAGINQRLSSEVQEATLKQIPLGRFGKPEEAAAAIMFLASESAAYITGHALNVNGGFLM